MGAGLAALAGLVGAVAGSFRLLVDCANVHGVSTIGSDWVYRHESSEVSWIYTQGVGCGTGYITNPRVDAR